MPFEVDKGSSGFPPGHNPTPVSTDPFLGALHDFLRGEQWEEEALDEFDRLTHCADWKPLMAKISSYVQSGISTWPKIHLYDTSNGKVRLGFTRCSLSLQCIYSLIYFFFPRNPYLMIFLTRKILLTEPVKEFFKVSILALLPYFL